MATRLLAMPYSRGTRQCLDPQSNLRFEAGGNLLCYGHRPIFHYSGRASEKESSQMTDQPTLETDAIRPTQERLAKGGILVPPKADRERSARPWFAAESAVSYYLSKGKISKRQADAGYQFQACWYVANGHPVRAQSYEPSIRGGTDDMSDARLGAKAKLQLYRNAHGEDLFNCLVSICGLDETYSEWAEDHCADRQAGKTVLKIALTKHADFLKLPLE